MAFDETYQTYIITQYPRVTTFYHPDDDGSIRNSICFAITLFSCARRHDNNAVVDLSCDETLSP
jgi:hypothetical protein